MGLPGLTYLIRRTTQPFSGCSCSVTSALSVLLDTHIETNFHPCSPFCSSHVLFLTSLSTFIQRSHLRAQKNNKEQEELGSFLLTHADTWQYILLVYTSSVMPSIYCFPSVDTNTQILVSHPYTPLLLAGQQCRSHSLTFSPVRCNYLHSVTQLTLALWCRCSDFPTVVLGLY